VLGNHGQGKGRGDELGGVQGVLQQARRARSEQGEEEDGPSLEQNRGVGFRFQVRVCVWGGLFVCGGLCVGAGACMCGGGGNSTFTSVQGSMFSVMQGSILTLMQGSMVIVVQDSMFTVSSGVAYIPGLLQKPVRLAGISPIMQSYTAYTYGSGRPYKPVTEGKKA